jgi:hypothetical protein
MPVTNSSSHPLSKWLFHVVRWAWATLLLDHIHGVALPPAPPTQTCTPMPRKPVQPQGRWRWGFFPLAPMLPNPSLIFAATMVATAAGSTRLWCGSIALPCGSIFLLICCLLSVLASSAAAGRSAPTSTIVVAFSPFGTTGCDVERLCLEQLGGFRATSTFALYDVVATVRIGGRLGCAWLLSDMARSDTDLHTVATTHPLEGDVLSVAVSRLHLEGVRLVPPPLPRGRWLRNSTHLSLSSPNLGCLDFILCHLVIILSAGGRH